MTREGCRVVYIALALLLSARMTTLHAQTRVVGVVVDTLDRPLVGVRVSAIGEARSTRTDSIGRFGLLPSKRVTTINVRALGYTSVDVDISALEGRPLRIILKRVAFALDTVRVRDQNSCATVTLAGFECRREAGVGYFHDAGELRSMRPRMWADMLDGFPDLRRYFTDSPHGQEIRVQAPPSQCLVELWNGQPRMKVDPIDDGMPPPRPMPASMQRQGAFQPDDYWVPSDVVAIEYYDDVRKVPARYRPLAWPPESQGCRLIIYWLRGAAKR